MLVKHKSFTNELNKFKSKVILLRHSIATLNTVHEHETTAIQYHHFLTSPYHLQRLELKQELTILCDSLSQRFNNDIEALNIIEDMKYFTLKSLRQKYENM